MPPTGLIKHVVRLLDIKDDYSRNQALRDDSFLCALEGVYEDHLDGEFEENWYPGRIDDGGGKQIAQAFRAKASELLADETQ